MPVLQPQPSSPSAPTARLLDWSTLQIRLLWAYQGSVDPGGRSGNYNTEHIKAWLIRRGEVEIEENRHTARACAGQWLLGNPGHDRRRFSEDADIVSLNFDLAWPTGEPLFQDEPIYVIGAADHPLLEKTAAELCGFIQGNFPRASISLPWQVSDVHKFVQLQQRLLDWVEAYISAMTACGAHPKRLGVADERILRVLGVLDEWPLMQKLDRARLAATAGLTVQHLDRLFLAHLGITPARYLENRRVEKARQNIGERSVPVKEVAYALGFLSASHFSRWFRQHLHTSPQQFRLAQEKRRREA